MKRPIVKVLIILLAALILGFMDLPSDTQKQLIPATPQSILDNKINLGLDLQGGSQLDYKIDLRKVPEEDKKVVVEGILNVITKRVNGLGVSEPNIYTSDVGDEKHLIVELAGIKDLNEAKAIVGKTIQLEFKEEKSAAEMEDNEEIVAQMKAKAESLLARAKAGEDLRVIGQEEAQANPSKVFFQETTEFQYKDEVPSEIADILFSLEAGQTVENVIPIEGATTVDEEGNYIPLLTGFLIVETTEKQDTERITENPASVDVSHILIAYEGAERAADITRTKDEAKARAEEVLGKLGEEGADFAELAKEYSDDAVSKEDGGKLPSPVVEGEAGYVVEFSSAALALKEVGQISSIVESPFGFHIIRAESIKEGSSETETEPQVKYISIYFSSQPDPWKATGLSGQHFVHADVQFNQNTFQPYVSIQFNDEGAKIFEELTRKNLGKQIAIFVGGQAVSAPTVQTVISGGQAQITGNFTIDTANELARDLNTGAIPAPIVLAGQYTIGATLGQEALQSSLYAGAFGLILLALYMILYYRLPGFLATVALAIYSIILLFLIKISLHIGVALGIATLIFIYLVYKILNNKESGAEKTVSGVIACFLLFFLSFLLQTPIVLTLAGVAGIILSIGMAVDANILIFERIKEEVRDGRSLSAAIEVGFDRAWSSIRDSNFSSLITCGILFYFGSSIIQGFAFNLAAGILVSMVTAITITRLFLNLLANTRFADRISLFGKPKKAEAKGLNIIGLRKFSYWFSGILIGLTLLGTLIFGLKLGLDFTGGTLMEFSFKEEVTQEQLYNALQESAGKTNERIKSGEMAVNVSDAENPVNISAEDGDMDLSKASIIPSDNGYIVKTPHISTSAHDILAEELKTSLGEFEETRFSTVGPTVGQSLQVKAVIAVIVAAVMIVLYVAFAFRKVPRHIGKWKFGISAIVALIHDLAIMLGVYVFLSLFFGAEIDALFITALLTILGFSVHDTIVVFDRLREKVKTQKRNEDFEDISNAAVNETIARSINTSLTLLITLTALAVLGSESIRFFVISLIVGVISGTYSSIFIATPVLVDWQKKCMKKRYQ
jgi:preprotein translocase SecF subunit/protein-export membrane protein SecD